MNFSRSIIHISWKIRRLCRIRIMVILTTKKVESNEKRQYLYKTLFLFVGQFLALTGCDLDLQKNYDYEPSVDDPYVKSDSVGIFSGSQRYVLGVDSSY